MAKIECFWIEPTDREKLSLRRYSSSTEAQGKCPELMGYHNASVYLGDTPVVWKTYDDGSRAYNQKDPSVKPPNDDPRWPKSCSCGYEFQDADQWQLFGELIYVRQGGSEEMLLRSAPPGAMWDAFWYPKSFAERGPDGMSLVVMTPGGDWNIDGFAKGGGRWSRTGTPPKVTVTPSILIDGRYHGWLTDGFLTDC